MFTYVHTCVCIFGGICTYIHIYVVFLVVGGGGWWFHSFVVCESLNRFHWIAKFTLISSRYLMIIVIPVAIGFVGVAFGVCFPVHPKQCRIIVHPLATPPPPPFKKPPLSPRNCDKRRVLFALLTSYTHILIITVIIVIIAICMATIGPDMGGGGGDGYTYAYIAIIIVTNNAKFVLVVWHIIELRSCRAQK